MSFGAGASPSGVQRQRDRSAAHLILDAHPTDDVSTTASRHPNGSARSADVETAVPVDDQDLITPRRAAVAGLWQVVHRADP